jgi:hypothetical protein
MEQKILSPDQIVCVHIIVTDKILYMYNTGRFDVSEL